MINWHFFKLSSTSVTSVSSKQQLLKSGCISHCVMWVEKREREPPGFCWATFSEACFLGQHWEAQYEASTFTGPRWANPRLVPRALFYQGNIKYQETALRKERDVFLFKFTDFLAEKKDFLLVCCFQLCLCCCSSKPFIAQWQPIQLQAGGRVLESKNFFSKKPFRCWGLQGQEGEGEPQFAMVIFFPFLSWQASENFTSWPIFRCHEYQGHPSDFTTDLHLHHVVQCLRSALLHPDDPRIWNKVGTKSALKKRSHL